MKQLLVTSPDLLIKVVGDSRRALNVRMHMNAPDSSVAQRHDADGDGDGEQMVVSPVRATGRRLFGGDDDDACPSTGI